MNGMQPAVAEPSPTTPPFETVYRDNYAHVWRALRRLGVPSRDVEDGAHEVFVVVHRRLGDFDSTRPMRPWLTGICHRVALAERRRARNKRELLGAPGDLERQRCERDGPEQDAHRRDRRQLVIDALQTLDMDRRLVFVMHELDEVACPEIARALDVPLNTVYSRLRVARVRFAAAVKSARSES